MYVIDHVTGFYKLVPTTDADRPKVPFPTKLSEAGLFASLAEHRPHPAAIGFEVAAGQWADGATIERFAAFPGSERIEQKPQKNAGGAWTHPNGTVLAQTLTLKVMGEDGKPHDRRVETRLMVRDQGEWTGYSYRWNDEQTDAELVGGAGDAAEFTVPDATAAGGSREQIWRFPSRTECLICHSRAAGFTLGFTPLQLDRDRDFGGRVQNQLAVFEQIGLFEGKLPERKADRARLTNPYDTKAPLEARVKSYLHVNCSTCHVAEGGGNGPMQVDLTTAVNAMNVVNADPIHDRFEIADAKVVAPGSPERSILFQRVSRRGTGQMPPLGTTEVDRVAVEAIEAWIRGLPKDAGTPTKAATKPAGRRRGR
jgi:mono/diheme cytochrome c family protein